MIKVPGFCRSDASREAVKVSELRDSRRSYESGTR